MNFKKFNVILKENSDIISAHIVSTHQQIGLLCNNIYFLLFLNVCVGLPGPWEDLNLLPILCVWLQMQEADGKHYSHQETAEDWSSKAERCECWELCSWETSPYKIFVAAEATGTCSHENTIQRSPSQLTRADQPWGSWNWQLKESFRESINIRCRAGRWVQTHCSIFSPRKAEFVYYQRDD